MTRERVTADQAGPAIGRALAKVRKAVIERVALNVAARAVKRAVELTDAEKLVDRGAYRRGWSSRRIPEGAEYFNGAPYAGVIEHGRRAGGRMPPLAPLIRWCRRKLGLKPKEARRRAFAIALKIARDGTRPHHIMARTNAEIPAMIRDEVRRLDGQKIR